MFIEQIIEFESMGPGPSGRTCNPTTDYFYDKTKISKENKSSSELLLTAKNIAEDNVSCFPSPGPGIPRTWTKSITKFIDKMLRFKREFKQR